MIDDCNIPDINIHKGSSSKTVKIKAYYADYYYASIKVSIKGSFLSFSVATNGETYKGTITFVGSDGEPAELLAITSITAY